MLGVPVSEQHRLPTWKGSARAKSIIFDHVLPHQKHLFLPLIAEHTTIVPLRHPYLTAKSWDDRGMDKADLIAMWEVMANEINPLDPFYLPLDVENRQDYLDELNEWTGLGLKTDWAPQGVKNNNADLRHTDLVPCDEILALCERIEPFLDRFY